jgi:hypothetical protein
MNPAHRNLQSQAGSWSAIQALRHVQIAEAMSLGYMQKKIQAGPDLPEAPVSSQMKIRMYNLIFGLGLRFKAPKVLADPENGPLEALEEEWAETRKSLKHFIDQYPEEWMSRGILKHPRAGMINLPDAIRFFNAHLQHHLQQVKRIQKELRS